MKTYELALEVEGQGFNITAIPWRPEELRVTVRSKGITEVYDYDIPARKLERNNVRMKKMTASSVENALSFARVESIITNKLVEWTLGQMA